METERQAQRAERQQQRADNNRRQAVGFFALLLLAVAFAVVVVRKNRSIRQKNLALVGQIDEAMAYRQKYEALKRLAAPPTPAETEAPTLSDADALAAATDDALFDRLRHVIETERLYLDPTFDRQALISRYGLTKERIGAAFAKGSDHPSLSAYVAQLRL